MMINLKRKIKTLINKHLKETDNRTFRSNPILILSTILKLHKTINKLVIVLSEIT
jgi:hypothetical protein